MWRTINWSPAKYGTPVSPVSSRRLRQIFLSRRQKCYRQHDDPSHNDQRSHGACGDLEFFPGGVIAHSTSLMAAFVFDADGDLPSKKPRRSRAGPGEPRVASPPPIQGWHIPVVAVGRNEPETNRKMRSRLGWRPLSFRHKRLPIRELIPLNRQSFPALDDPAHGKLAPLPTN